MVGIGLVQSEHYIYVKSILGQSRRRLATIIQAMKQRLYFIECKQQFTQCWYNVGPTSATLEQH